jgi:hypothetical protein
VLELLSRMQPTSSNYRIDLLTKSYSTLAPQLQQQQQQQSGGLTPLHEPWFDMQAIQWQLPADVIAGWASADVSTDLALPPPNPFVPTDFTLKGTPAAAGAGADADGTAAAAAAGAHASGAAAAQTQQQQAQQQQEQEIASLPAWVLAPVGGRPAAVSVLLATPPAMILDKPGRVFFGGGGPSY